MAGLRWRGVRRHCAHSAPMPELVRLLPLSRRPWRGCGGAAGAEARSSLRPPWRRCHVLRRASEEEAHAAGYCAAGAGRSHVLRRASTKRSTPPVLLLRGAAGAALCSPLPDRGPRCGCCAAGGSRDLRHTSTGSSTPHTGSPGSTTLWPSLSPMEVLVLPPILFCSLYMLQGYRDGVAVVFELRCRSIGSRELRFLERCNGGIRSWWFLTVAARAAIR